MPRSRPAPSSQPSPLLSLTLRQQLSFGADQLQEPIGIAVLPEGRLAVTDTRQRSVEIFDMQGQLLHHLALPKSVERPMHADSALGTLWIADYGSDALLQLGARGQILRTIRAGFDAPAGVLAVADGTLYVPDFYHHQIVVLDSTGTLRARWGAGKGHPFTYPTDIAASPDGERLYVADAYAHRIRVLNRQGQSLGGWGEQGRSPGQFDVATGIATDQQGRVYVSDFNNGRVQIFDAQGRLLGLFGTKGSAEGQFDRPTDLLVVADRIYVVDFGNHRIQILQRSASRMPLR